MRVNPESRMGSPRSGNPSLDARQFDGFLLRNKSILRFCPRRCRARSCEHDDDTLRAFAVRPRKHVARESCLTPHRLPSQV
jgi:hypothetical protein